MNTNRDQLSHEENQFLDRLAERALPEPSEASWDRIRSHAATQLTEQETCRPLPAARRLGYPQLAASILAASVVLVLLGVCWYSMAPKTKNAQPDPQGQIANNSIQKPKPQPTEPKTVAVDESLDPMAFDDTYGRLAVDSTRQKVNSFWNNEASWQSSQPTDSVDQRLSTVRYRIEQLKRRSELDDLYRNEPKNEEGSQFDRLVPSRYVWFDTPWYLCDRDV